MKKVFMLLVAAGALAFASCGEKEEEKKDKKEEGAGEEVKILSVIKFQEVNYCLKILRGESPFLFI